MRHAALFQHAVRAGAGVLHIAGGLPFEIEHLVVGEGDVLYLVVVQRTEDDGADAHRFCRFLFIFEGRIFFRDDGERLFDALIDDVFEIDDAPLAGGHGAFFQRYHAVGDVDEIFRPFLAHQFQYLEELPEMQVLLVGDDVEALVKIVRLLAVDRRGEVARGVQRGAVRAQDEAGRHVVGGEVDDLRPLAFDEKPFLFEFVDDGLHLVDVKALARPAVEMHVEKVVYPAHVFEG